MRNELNNIERIEMYLTGQLSEADRLAFEDEMKTNTTLREEVELQRDLIDGITRKSLAQDAQRAHKKYKLGKGGLNWGLGDFAILVVAAAAWFLAPQFSLESSENLRYNTNEIGTEQFADADKHLPSQLFTVDAAKDTVIQTEGGITMTILANTFLDETGHPAKGNIDLEVKEALDPLSIMKAGLTTMSGDQLLESGGMFYVNGRQGKKSLQINPEQGIYTQVPTDEKQPNMQLFDGKRMADGRIDWVNPKPLETFLTPVEITTLDFYPPEYLDELENRGVDRTDKRFTDSLYYSYADKFGDVGEATKDQSTDPVSWSVDTQIDPKHPEGIVLRIVAKIDDGWRIAASNKPAFNMAPYPLQINVSPRPEREYGVQFPEPTFVSERNWSNQTVPTYSGEVVFLKTCFINQEQCSVNVDIRFMAFNDNYALAPDDVTLTVPIANCYEEIPEEDSSTELVYGISPASIKTIWNEKFNNTNLATKEFEERLAHIHNTCDQWILDYYVNNLDKRLSTLDSAVAQKRSSSSRDYFGPEYAEDSTEIVYPEPAMDKFWEFARRGDGRVETDNKYAEFLKGYYHRQAKIEAEAIRKVRQQYDEEHWEKLREAQEQRNGHASAEAERTLNNWKEEYQTNLKEAYDQLGYDYPPIERGPGVKTNNAVVTNPGWKNVDRYVAESVTKRETLDYTDNDGNRAVIKYEPISLEIANAAEFDRVLVYMLPNDLYSFQRMMQNGNKYSEKLNELFEYDVMCIGFKDGESFIHHIKKAKPKDYGTVKLKRIGEMELEKLLYRVKDYSVQRNLKEDLAFQKSDIKEQKRVAKRMERERLRNEMLTVVFPCSPVMFFSDAEEEPFEIITE